MFGSHVLQECVHRHQTTYSIALNCGLKLSVSEECCRLQCPILSTVGSMEEKWYLEIMDKGSVSCPTCQAVGRKTIEGLKKHMENCKQVSYFVAFHDC
jgi:uncharacterized Zn-finger protein